jgi:transposase
MVKGYDPLLLEPDVWTGKADAYALEPMRGKRAEIHRGSRRRCIGPLREAGYTSAIVITEPDPTRPLQSGGVHIRPQMTAPFSAFPASRPVTAATLVVEMPELGTLDARQVASLAGLAPITRQSGTWQGRAFIRGGRAQIRRALYMPALVAARFNPDLKETFDRLIAAGKPPKIAITAVVRKLLILANALLRQERKWRPTAT